MKYSDEDYRYVLCYSGVPSCWRVQPEDMPVDRPIPMILFCPLCGVQHIDAPEKGKVFYPEGAHRDGPHVAIPGWDNPPHRSHLCSACGCIWRPADVPTTGVEKIETCGKNDTFDPARPRELPRSALTGKYGEVLSPFLSMMALELQANAGKGDRPGWLSMDRKTALLEIFYHLAKLQKAVKNDDRSGIQEYSADVANMSMMLADVCGALGVPRP